MKKNGNEKSDAFKRLAEHRTEKAIHYIGLLGNLSNITNYRDITVEAKDYKTFYIFYRQINI